MANQSTKKYLKLRKHLPLIQHSSLSASHPFLRKKGNMKHHRSLVKLRRNRSRCRHHLHRTRGIVDSRTCGPVIIARSQIYTHTGRLLYGSSRLRDTLELHSRHSRSMNSRDELRWAIAVVSHLCSETSPTYSVSIFQYTS